MQGIGIKSLQYKEVLDYQQVLQEATQANKSLLRHLYDKYIPVKAKGGIHKISNTSIYDCGKDKIVVKWDE